MGLDVVFDFDNVEASVLKAQAKIQMNSFITGGKPILGHVYRLMETQTSYRGSFDGMKVMLTAYPVVKLTPKGQRYVRPCDRNSGEYGYREVLLLNSVEFSFACRTIELAIMHFIRRKLCQQDIYRNKLLEVETVLERAQLGPNFTRYQKPMHPLAFGDEYV